MLTKITMSQNTGFDLLISVVEESSISMKENQFFHQGILLLN